ncbi:ferritin family protein [Vallitaleaceae bacterium 9-2]
MQPKFTGAEVLQLAISMEEEGVKFYEKYATMADLELKEILLGMAEDEKEHAKVFKSMYNELNVDASQEDYLFSDQVQEFFASYAKNEGFNRSQAPIDSVRDALKIGAETERVTINYYVNLLEFANDKVKEVLNRIIKEEEKHLERLEALI